MLPSLHAHLQLWAGGRWSLSTVKCTPNDKMSFLSNSTHLAVSQTWLHVLKLKWFPTPSSLLLRISYSLSLICQPDIRRHEAPHHHHQLDSWPFQKHKLVISPSLLRMTKLCHKQIHISKLFSFSSQICLTNPCTNIKQKYTNIKCVFVMNQSFQYCLSC